MGAALGQSQGHRGQKASGNRAYVHSLVPGTSGGAAEVAGSRAHGQLPLLAPPMCPSSLFLLPSFPSPVAKWPPLTRLKGLGPGGAH